MSLMVKFPVGVSSLFLSMSSMFKISPIITASTQLSHTWAHSLLSSQNREWDMQTRAGLDFADQHLYTRQRSKKNPTLCKNIPQLSWFFLPQKYQGLSTSPKPFWPVSVSFSVFPIPFQWNGNGCGYQRWCYWKPYKNYIGWVAVLLLRCLFWRKYVKKTNKQNI